MGIKNLNTLIYEYAKEGVTIKSLGDYRNKRIAIDANVYIYKYLYGNSNHINGIFFQINKLMKHGIIPVYIFDGKPPKEKEATVINRQNNKVKLKTKINHYINQLQNIEKDISSKEKGEKQFNILNEIKRLQKKLIYVTDDIIVKTYNLLDLMGVTYILAPTEAEHYCSILARENIVDGVLSEDMDAIACGSFIVLRNFSNKQDYVYEYNLNIILSKLHLTFHQLIDVCILCGNDYINRLRGIDHHTAYKLIRKYKTIENIVSSKLYSFPTNYNYKTLRKIYKLEDICITTKDIVNINSNKEYNIPNLINFLKNNSSIDSSIFLNRIAKLYKKDFKTCDFKYNCLKSSYFNRFTTGNTDISLPK